MNSPSKRNGDIITKYFPKASKKFMLKYSHKRFIMTFFLLILTGLSVGIISTFFGVGGGIVAIPALYMLFPKITPQIAISSCMGMIFINSMINVRSFIKIGKKPNLKVVPAMGSGMLVGVIIGIKTTTYLNPIQLKVFFAALLYFVAGRLLFSRKLTSPGETWAPGLDFSDRVKEFFVAMTGGIIAGLTGLGGGAIMIPLFITVLRIPLKLVPLYSNLVMGFGACVGVINYSLFFGHPKFTFGNVIDLGQIGMVNVVIVAILAVGSMFTSKIGATLSQKVPEKTSRRLFATLLVMIGGKIFYQTLSIFN